MSSLGRSASVTPSAAVQRLLDAERYSVAQEVHDVVGHGLVAVQLQADIALHIDEHMPQRVREALLAISTACAQAVTELREAMATIHPAPQATHRRAFTPALAEVEALCKRLTCTGVCTVDLRVVGQPRPLPPAVDATAYRLLQEALTNVAKHSPHPAAQVVIEYLPEQVTVQVTNQDLPAAPFAPGLGITGMRRRAVGLGGTFAAGPGPEPRTFQVRARLPRWPRDTSGNGHESRHGQAATANSTPTGGGSVRRAPYRPIRPGADAADLPPFHDRAREPNADPGSLPHVGADVPAGWAHP